ncbi:rhamnosyltransferase WsaF family glycosyltransferase [Thiohalocapsa halophila]|uniref:rhamnosyltransferase WsaF family glycosyltransferase n=1 Tax=Thiohalocapsa halophila TaxID=69359 RepID=UPI001F5B7571|nr:hypothetical protein [Thiohalocapsa halophila]
MRLLFYAQPQQPRFLFELALRALRRAIAQNGFAIHDWEFLSIGEPLPPIDLGSGATLVNRPWLAFEDYAALIRSADVILSLMLSPHTSYPPLEGAAAGAAVVTTTFQTKTADELHKLSPDLFAAAPTTEAITAALCEAAHAAATKAVKRDQLSLPADWTTAMEATADEVNSWFHRGSAAQSTPDD